MKRNFEFGVEAFVGEEGRNLSGCMRSVVVSEFGEREERNPIVLLVVDIDAKILFEDLVNSLGLSIGFGVVGCRKVRFDVEESGERFPEARNEVFSAIRDDVGGSAVFREDMD